METNEKIQVEYFNEYGNPPWDGPIDLAGGAIADIAENVFLQMVEDGASVIEIRAAAFYLAGCVDCSASHLILKKNMEQRKAERIKNE